MSTDAHTDGPYETDADVLAVVRRFESCGFPPDEFNHRPHLIVALYYSINFAAPEAERRMRESIHGFLAHHGLDRRVYHETITLFWMRRVRGFLARADAARPLARLTNELVEECGDSRLISDYYSKQVLESEEARAGWVGPDLKPLEF